MIPMTRQRKVILGHSQAERESGENPQLETPVKTKAKAEGLQYILSTDVNIYRYTHAACIKK